MRNYKANMIVPIYLYHLDNIPLEELRLSLKINSEEISGFSIFLEPYNLLTAKQIENYKIFLHEELNREMLFSTATGHPSKFY
jgi:hypothetical protein